MIALTQSSSVWRTDVGAREFGDGDLAAVVGDQRGADRIVTAAAGSAAGSGSGGVAV
ncbi:MAG TPA: hypothetical protein H9786_04810 [Candidatus Brachybacterium merdavium]|uniref:Uncharacterized protein n=1 Tax=Candidatus Brachybacterium merdavium TaxID=2838513 RepID=A0A9D2LC74_9MICO|nr:hypothetical protein [Candidatus Brachybacterium merdavium]